MELRTAKNFRPVYYWISSDIALIGIIGFTEYRPCIVQCFSGGCCKSEEGSLEVFTDVKYIGPWGGGCQDLRNHIQGGSAGGVIIRLRTLGGFHHRVARRLAGMQLNLNAEGGVVVFTIGRGCVRGRPGGCGDLRPLQPKHNTPIYHDLSDIGAVYGIREATRSAGDQEIVVSWRILLGESDQWQTI